MTKVVSVLIADDSALMRREIRRILESDPGIKVVGLARNGKDAVEMTKTLNPDVVTMDINMPIMDGMTALQHIMMECPRPVIMLSSLTQEGTLTTYEALELGAVDYIAKPGGTVSVNIEQLAHEMISKIKSVVGANLTSLAAGRRRRRALRTAEKKSKPKTPQTHSRIIVIGESTGGPNTIFDILPLLPADLGVPIIIVQHMPGAFTPSFANRLNQYSQLTVEHAESGVVVNSNHVYLAPGDLQLVLSKRGKGEPGFVLRTSHQPADALYKPSVNITMESALECYGSGVIGVLLTGMGDDGANAMVKVREAGGRTIAESEETCVVFGMPKEAIRRGGAEFVLPSYKIADKIMELVLGTYTKGGKRGLPAANHG